MIRRCCQLRWMLPLLAAAMISGSGCKEKKGEKPKESPVLSPIPKFRPMKAKQRVSQKKEMREMAKVTDEMRRRAMGGIGMGGPVNKMLVQAGKLPVANYPESYKSFLADMKGRLNTLGKTTRYKSDYNRLIESCLACHQVYAPQVVISIERLAIK